MWMNEHEIEEACAVLDGAGTPHLAAAATTVHNLMTWTNQNSDGWPYWPDPSRAAAGLMDALHEALMSRWRGLDPVDTTAAELARLQRPVRRFLTGRGVAHAAVIQPPRDPADLTLF